jgi:hypothetical protein
MIFRKIPLTIQDQSSNLRRFVENKHTLESPLLQVIPNSLSSTLQKQIQQSKKKDTSSAFASSGVELCSTMPTAKDALSSLLQQLIYLVPPVYQTRSFIGFVDMKCGPLSSYKEETSFDDDGNSSLLSLFIFLEQPDANDKSLCTIHWNTTPVQITPGLAVLFDHRISYHIEEKIEKEHNPLVFQLKCLYNLLPDKAFSLPLYDQIVLWRGQMRKCFINSGSFIDVGPSSTVPIGVSQLEDPTKEQCSSCLQFIPITSTSCPVCSDRLIPQKQIISSRQKGLWISTSIYA